MKNLKSKLSSRKFWVAIISFATALMIFFNVDNITIEKASVVIASFGTLVAYLLGESYIDGKREESTPRELIKESQDIIKNQVVDIKIKEVKNVKDSELDRGQP